MNIKIYNQATALWQDITSIKKYNTTASAWENAASLKSYGASAAWEEKLNINPEILYENGVEHVTFTGYPTCISNGYYSTQVYAEKTATALKYGDNNTGRYIHSGFKTDKAAKIVKRYLVAEISSVGTVGITNTYLGICTRSGWIVNPADTAEVPIYKDTPIAVTDTNPMKIYIDLSAYLNQSFWVWVASSAAPYPNYTIITSCTKIYFSDTIPT